MIVLYLFGTDLADFLPNSQAYTGGSVDGACLLNARKTDVCLNWSGMKWLQVLALRCMSAILLKIVSAVLKYSNCNGKIFVLNEKVVI